ncbi:MAG: zinc ribbon domain-containing protein [Clostridiales bacterium]|nr:zinc ribbon domain-containing protein [Clostridiales bacterium]
MKMIALTCPQCHAELAENGKFCPYCGTRVFMEDEALRVKYTYESVDNARIREADVQEKIRLKELEIEHLKLQEQTERKRILMKAKVIIFLLMVVVLAGLLIAYASTKDETFVQFALLLLIGICLISPILFRVKT